MCIVHYIVYCTLHCVFYCAVRTARWCTISAAEMAKCKQLATAVESRAYTDSFKLTCYTGFDLLDCMDQIRNDLADLVSLDAGLASLGGEMYTLKPLVAEDYTGLYPIYPIYTYLLSLSLYYTSLD